MSWLEDHIPVAFYAQCYGRAREGRAPWDGYGFAWVGHFFFASDRPAAFTYPLWSLRGDFRMFRFMLLGRMGSEIQRAERLSPPGPSDQGSEL